MVGATHTITPHDVLTPVNTKVGSGNLTSSNSVGTIRINQNTNTGGGVSTGGGSY
jgi:hypothetical protein